MSFNVMEAIVGLRSSQRILRTIARLFPGNLSSTNVRVRKLNPHLVFGAASFSWASQVFVCGGRLDLMWNIIGQCFHFAESSAKWISRASLLLPRFLSESTSLNNGTNTLISGGYTPQGFTRSSEVWDGTSWNWGELALPIPLYGHCLVELDPFRLLLSGGFTIDSKPSQQSWIYDRVGKIWKSLEPWPIVLNRVGTASKCIKMLDGKILLLGGGTTTALMFEPHTEQWFQMQPVPVECDAPLMVRYQKDVHLIGGCGDMRSIYRLDHSTNQWLDMGPVSEFRMNNLAGARVPQTFQHDSSC
ncbi:hypothetical protein TCAL_00245 [Tigriopus californicus]|uniref:BACK domain-containing protein n=1 Tax=Tigriopus californicus TaxID=6832 RepID=A0A553P1K0_TIGCA|nr:hypothetical protein TCAL_00245 [Tigriopus californicus]